MIGLNIDTFGRSNFVDSYIVKGMPYGHPLLAVEVVDAQLCSELIYSECYWLIRENSKDYFIYFIPDEYLEDYELFVQGKYTQMSDEVKDLIRMITKLRYKEQHGNGMESTDVILRALDRGDEPLANKWRELYGEDVTLPDELLSIPAERSFITLNI